MPFRVVGTEDVSSYELVPLSVVGTEDVSSYDLALGYPPIAHELLSVAVSHHPHVEPQQQEPCHSHDSHQDCNHETHHHNRPPYPYQHSRAFAACSQRLQVCCPTRSTGHLRVCLQNLPQTFSCVAPFLLIFLHTPANV